MGGTPLTILDAEARQLATYIGWRINRIIGEITAGALFVIPSIFVMLLLSAWE